MSELVKKTKKKGAGYKKPPVPGPGRPKGSKNKFTSLKDAFLEAFHELGGVDGLVKWAKESQRNRGTYYQILSKMLPTNVTMDANGKLIIMRTERGNGPEDPAKQKKETASSDGERNC